MDRPFAIRATTYFCVCILSMVSVALHGQDRTKPAKSQAQITNVRVGAVSIAIPSPTNDLVEAGPDYRVIFEPLAPANNRLVAAFVPQDKMDAVHKGDTPPMDEYALVEVARRMEFAEIDSATFQQIEEVLGKQFGGDIGQFSRNGQEEINHNLEALGNSVNVKIDKPVPLGIFFAMTNAIGVGPYNVNGVTTRMAGCLALLRVRGRVLSVFTYAPYKDQGTVMWVKTTSEQWADAILKANEGPNGPSQ
jgi:hypothetical protein